MKNLEIRISRAVASAHHRGELLPVAHTPFMGDVRHRRVHPTAKSWPFLPHWTGTQFRPHELWRTAKRFI